MWNKTEARPRPRKRSRAARRRDGIGAGYIGREMWWYYGAARVRSHPIAHVDLHLSIQPVAQQQVVRHADAVRLHRVTLAIIVVADVGVVEVADLALARGRHLSQAHPTLQEPPQRRRSHSRPQLRARCCRPWGADLGLSDLPSMAGVHVTSPPHHHRAHARNVRA